MRSAIYAIAEEFAIDLQTESIPSSLTKLIKKLYKRQGPVAVLIDNYDQSIVDLFAKPEHVLCFYELLHLFYKALDVSRNYTKFVMLTGEVEYHEFGVFSTLDKINDISANQDFARLVAFTQAEVEEIFLRNLPASLAQESVRVKALSESCLQRRILKKQFFIIHFL